jgi:glutamate dehydrogenase/leucine dehydrogenase
MKMTNINPYETAKKQILWVYDFLEKKGISWQFIEEFLYPDRVIEVNIPVIMDSWDVKVFKWYRSQHKSIRWPYKWWIRFHPDVTKDEVIALSTWMSIKVWVVDLPLGWWKWGVIVNPKELSERELEILSRGYVRAIYKSLWPDVDVPAPDVNTNSKIMARMVDEYSKLVWKWTPWAFTGKPLSLWGSRWREIATSLGGLYVLEKYLEIIWDKLEWKRVVIQWSWNAGLNFAKLAVKNWAKVIAISDSKGWIFNPDWIDIDAVEKIKKDWWSVTLLDYEKITNEELLQLECDILVLAALENQITDKNVGDVKAKVILELANWPTTPEADEILFKNWIVVLPDILANAGWVTVSYFEQIQWNMNYYWPEKEVYDRLSSIMKRSTEEVVKLAKELNVDFRKSAYVISLFRQYDAWKYLK